MASNNKRQNIRCAQGKEYVEALAIQTPVASTNSSPPSFLQTLPGSNALRFMRLREVMAITGLGRSTIYKMKGDGTFPDSAHITISGRAGRAVGWVNIEIYAWMNERLAERKNDSSRLRQDDVQAVPATHSSEWGNLLSGIRKE